MTEPDRPPRVCAKLPKPLGEMTEDELDEWCTAFVSTLPEAAGVSFATEAEEPS